jgi:UDP-glucose 4-epimerase
MTTVLITGGMGVIGSLVTRNLISQGIRVVAYQRHRTPALLKDIIDKVDFVEGDVLDLASLNSAIKKFAVERVVHMAMAAGIPVETNPFQGYRVNVDGAINVFEACRTSGIKRVVFTSSKAVYATVQGEYAPPISKPITEDYPKDPQRVYGATKLFAENMGTVFRRVYGLDLIVLRFGSCYGPGKAARGGLASVRSKIIESAMFAKPIKVTCGEDYPDDLVYHRDLAAGIVSACFVSNPEHRVFHLGTGKGVTIRQLIGVLEKMFGKVPVEIAPATGESYLDPNPCIYDIGRARRELGYEPVYDLEKGVKDYVETTRQMELPPGI